MYVACKNEALNDDTAHARTGGTGVKGQPESEAARPATPAAAEVAKPVQQQSRAPADDDDTDLTKYLQLESSSKAQHFSAPPELPPKVSSSVYISNMNSEDVLHMLQLMVCQSQHPGYYTFAME